MALEVTPEDFPAVTAQLLAIHTDLKGALDSSYAPGKPTAPGLEPASKTLSTAIGTFTTHFHTVVAPAVDDILGASSVMVPIASNYLADDSAGGAVVGGAGAGLEAV
jgi:hypothetical protein